MPGAAGGRVSDVVGGVDRAHPIGVLGQGPGQVQRPVHQSVTLARGAGEVDGDLAVLDPPGRAGVLTLHPTVAVPL